MRGGGERQIIRSRARVLGSVRCDGKGEFRLYALRCDGEATDGGTRFSLGVVMEGKAQKLAKDILVPTSTSAATAEIKLD
jgi:hypothetical protein